MNLDALRRRIDRRLSGLFAGKEPQSLYGPMAYALNAGGKRIRPVLVLLACEAVGGKTTMALDAAVAVELLHTFTLVHDDIMDHDPLRRGKPTVHVRWDESTGILVGDGLVTMASETLLRTAHPALHTVLQVFTRGLRTVCEGQAMDKAFESRSGVTLAEYKRMVERKTAALLEMSCAIGALLGDGTAREWNALRRFALRLGTAFQIQDDLLDIAAESDVLGKPIGSDIGGKKKTYLSIHFHEHASRRQQAVLASRWGKRRMTRSDIKAIRKVFEETGTLVSARAAVRSTIDRAVGALTPLEDSPAKEALCSLARSLGERTY